MKVPEPKGFTRRDLASLAAALPLVTTAPLSAQTQALPIDELADARQQMQRRAEQLRRFIVPAATEPSFTFRP
jgi:hypothetical protein